MEWLDIEFLKVGEFPFKIIKNPTTVTLNSGKMIVPKLASKVNDEWTGTKINVPLVIGGNSFCEDIPVDEPFTTYFDFPDALSGYITVKAAYDEARGLERNVAAERGSNSVLLEFNISKDVQECIDYADRQLSFELPGEFLTVNDKSAKCNNDIYLVGEAIAALIKPVDEENFYIEANKGENFEKDVIFNIQGTCLNKDVTEGYDLSQVFSMFATSNYMTMSARVIEAAKAGDTKLKVRLKGKGTTAVSTPVTTFDMLGALGKLLILSETKGLLDYFGPIISASEGDLSTENYATFPRINIKGDLKISDGYYQFEKGKPINPLNYSIEILDKSLKFKTDKLKAGDDITELFTISSDDTSSSSEKGIPKGLTATVVSVEDSKLDFRIEGTPTTATPTNTQGCMIGCIFTKEHMDIPGLVENVKTTPLNYFAVVKVVEPEVAEQN